MHQRFSRSRRVPFALGLIYYAILLCVSELKFLAAIDSTPNTTVVEIGSGDFHSCARFTDNSVRCWGEAAYGVIGVEGASNDDFRPTPITIPNLTGVVGLATNAYSTCAWLDDGSVRCWGKQGSSRLLSPNCPQPRVYRSSGFRNTPRGKKIMIRGPAEPYCSVPTEIGGLANVVQVAPGSAYACALTREGNVLCWGNNYYGTLGDGGGPDRSEPKQIRFDGS